MKNQKIAITFRSVCHKDKTMRQGVIVCNTARGSFFDDDVHGHQNYPEMRATDNRDNHGKKQHSGSALLMYLAIATSSRAPNQIESPMGIKRDTCKNHGKKIGRWAA